MGSHGRQLCAWRCPGHGAGLPSSCRLLTPRQTRPAVSLLLPRRARELVRVWLRAFSPLQLLILLTAFSSQHSQQRWP